MTSPVQLDRVRSLDDNDSLVEAGMSHAQEATDKANAEKRWVAASSVGAALVLTGGKILVGILTNSLGILSEAAHSGLDLVAAVVTLWAVRAASRPADSDHTYGHGKIENLSALFETLLLLLTCVWIIWEAGHRLFGSQTPDVDASVWAFAVVIVSMVIDFSRSRALQRTAEKYKSQALEADALHFSTDIWSSAVVLVGLVCVRVGEAFAIPWLHKADAIAALGVALIVVWVSTKLGKKSMDDLLDRVPPDLRGRVQLAAQVPGVRSVRLVRLRRAGPEYFVDVTLSTEADAGIERAHDLAHDVENAVREVLPGADVVVHVEPSSSPEEDLATSVRRLAHKFQLHAHAIQLRRVHGEQHLELHLEVPEHLHVGEAHDLATQFEQELTRTHPGIGNVVTHIEPVGARITTCEAEFAESRVPDILHEMARRAGGAWRPFDIVVTRGDAQLAVSLRCEIDGSENICCAHAITEQIERDLRRQVSGLGKVVIHVEPR